MRVYSNFFYNRFAILSDRFGLESRREDQKNTDIKLLSVFF